ncbi:MAG: trypsin-like peptidase domain-containing protein [Pseudomonadales bacterium]|nr:trypsin-like peptidase domain-containing protein [Candidatus Woesebacteria bacterium]MCB9802002.1 trypsin-like peptidase domain-containing protein [Pseudomonadales bacterium]
MTARTSFLLGLGISILIMFSFFAGALADRVFVIRPLDALAPRITSSAENASNDISNLGTLLIPEQENSVADVAERASTSVVTVSVKTQQQLFEEVPGLFGFGFQVPSGEVQEVQQDIGTGFVVSEGLVVTNKHVVSGAASEYLVITADNTEHVVSQIYRDPEIDMAILKVANLTSAALPLGDSDSVRVGEGVIAIGTALGEFRHTVTTGVVSGLGRAITAGGGVGSATESLENVIQTDAAINPGNSGGPLLSSAGQVIGVNVAVSQYAENIGFAIPINVIKHSLEHFNNTGQFTRPFLGVGYSVVSEQAALANEVPQGAYVTQVQSGSTADRAGLRPGDIITSFAGTQLKDVELATLINDHTVGESVVIEYWREGVRQTVSVTLEAANE